MEGIKATLLFPMSELKEAMWLRINKNDVLIKNQCTWYNINSPGAAIYPKTVFQILLIVEGQSLPTLYFTERKQIT